jgi:NAD(P)-dependent dehydrogenase (short-subunit alcohol dehydrogenase family)
MKKLVIVAGAAGALGQAVVRDLCSRGHKVFAVDRIAAEIEDAESVIVDLGDDAAVARCYDDIGQGNGPIGALVNVAGGFAWEPVAGGTAATWDAMFRINLATVVNSCRAALKYLERGSAIVNIGAAGAIRPGHGMAPYAASKAGVHALTESLAEELRPSGIRANALLPTVIDTPANRRDMPDADPAEWLLPEDAARAVALLLSDDAAAITGNCLRLSR